MTDGLNADDIGRLFRQIDSALGLPSDHLLRMFDEKHTNDWTLVVQCHAILETATNELLQATIRPKAVAEWITRLPFSRRLNLCGECELVSKDLLDGLKAVSEIRNQLVHSATGLAFTFEAYLKTKGGVEKIERLGKLVGGFQGESNGERARWLAWGATARIASELLFGKGKDAPTTV